MNSQIIKETLSLLPNYAIYGSGYFATELLMSIRANRLKEPDFIFDGKPFSKVVAGITVLPLNDVCITSLSHIVLASDIHMDDMRETILRHFGRHNDLRFICLPSNVRRKSANDIYRIDYIPHTGFLYCDGQYVPGIDAVNIFDGDKLIGQAELNFRNYKSGGTNGWRFEKVVKLETGCVKAHLISGGKILNICERKLSEAAGCAIQTFNAKVRPALVVRDCIFLEFAGFNSPERKNVINKRFFEKLNEYLNIFNWELIVISHTHSEVDFKSVDLDHGPLPERIVTEISSSEKFADFREKFQESVRTTACNHFFSEQRPNLDVASYNKGLLEKSARFEEALKKYRPKLYLAWTEFSSLTNTFRALCKAHEIPVLFLHEGFLPDTMQIDTCGEVVLSYMCRNSEKFRAFPIVERDLENAKKTLDYALRQGSRNEFSDGQKDALERVTNAKREGRKIVFYACCNDWMMGLRPIWRQCAETLATPFIDSYDALSEIIYLCQANNWHLVVKPHPYYNSSLLLDIIKRHHDFTDLTISYLANPHAILQTSDVLVTLMSSTAYEAMSRDVPVVLLGGHPLRGQGIAYEFTSTTDLTILINHALMRTGWDSKRDAWLHFVARMIRYYLFPSSPEAEVAMDKNIEHAARFILKQTARSVWNSEFTA